MPTGPGQIWAWGLDGLVSCGNPRPRGTLFPREPSSSALHWVKVAICCRHLLRSQAGHTPMASKGLIHEVDGEPSQGDGVRPWTEMKEWSQEALGMALP